MYATLLDGYLSGHALSLNIQTNTVAYRSLLSLCSNFIVAAVNNKYRMHSNVNFTEISRDLLLIRSFYMKYMKFITNC
jgi:hypothetical protein